MKFFHLSDLHIGLKLMNRDLREEQIDILRQITELAKAEKPDAVVIAGDIYDKAVPAAEAVEIFDGFMTELKKAVPKAEIMLISGNHDDGVRLSAAILDSVPAAVALAVVWLVLLLIAAVIQRRETRYRNG